MRTRESDTYYMNNDYKNTIKVYEDYFEFKTDRKRAEIQKTGFPKEQVENTDLYKPVLNKTMTTQE